MTSSCSPIVYTANLFPKQFFNNTFICDPANNLIHRDILEVKGSLYTAKRGDADCEFLASTDNWFRPVCLSVGPDGAIYVLDFYREVIETPLSLPDDIKKRLNLESRDRGRIWRIVPEKTQHSPFQVIDKKSTSGDLIAHLNDSNYFKRIAAQRLLVELRKKRKYDSSLRRFIEESENAVARVHALWILHTCGWLREDDVIAALKSKVDGERETGLRLAEDFAAKSESIRKAVLSLLEDPLATRSFSSLPFLLERCRPAKPRPHHEVTAGARF